MRRSPLYVFKNRQSTGIYNVPLESMILIQDVDGNDTPKTIQLISKEGLTPDSTINDLLNNASLYIDPFELTEIPSQLEKITEGNHTGWRILGRDPSKYANIGNQAIDFSIVTANVGLLSPYGASGNYSIATGVNTISSGVASFSSGIGTRAINEGSVAIGKYNKGIDSKNIFEIGIGTDLVKINAFEVNTDGIVAAPEMTIADIQAYGDYALVTKEYSDANLDSKLEKTGGIITGDLKIEGELETDNNVVFNSNLEVGHECLVGVNGSTQSRIRFKSITTTPDRYPSIFWDNTALPPDFYITTGDNQNDTPKKIWHAGNDGSGSGLDADTIDGIQGEDLATKDDVEQILTDQLNEKYDKAGGSILGDVQILGNLRINQNAEINGDFALNGEITTDLNILENVDVHKTLNVRDNVFIRNKLYIGNEPASSNSIIEFTSISGNYNPAIYWNDDHAEFEIKKDNTNINLTIWHAGNFNPDDKMDKNTTVFNNLTIDDTLTVNTRALIPLIDNNCRINGNLDINSDVNVGDNLTIGSNYNNTSRLSFGDGNTNTTTPTIYWDSNLSSFRINTLNDTNLILWHSGNLDTSDFITSNGGTITGSLNINQNLEVDDITTFNGQVRFLNSITSNINATGNIYTAGTLTAADTAQVLSLKIGQSNNVSTIEFTDNSSNDQPKIYWKNDSGAGLIDFFVQTPSGTDFPLWHAGNFNPDDKMDVNASTFNDLTVNNTLTVGGSSSFGKPIEIGLDADYSGVFFTTGDSNAAHQPALYWDDNQKEIVVNTDTVAGVNIWHADNLSKAEFVSTQGDTIRGKLIISNDDDGNGNIIAWGDLQVENIVEFGSTLDVVGDVTASANVSIGQNLTVSGTSTLTGDVTMNNNLTVSGNATISGTTIIMDNLPTTDPGVVGQLWNDGGTLKISQ